MIIGPPGSGKTTLAATVANRIGGAHIELDAVLHGPSGSEPTVEEFRAVVLPRLEADTWVVDAWNERMLGTLALERADFVIYLDPPLAVILWRLIKRSLVEILSRRELWNGNRQTWGGAFGGRNSLVGYAIRRHPDMRLRVPQVLASPSLGHLCGVRLGSASEVRRWLNSESCNATIIQ